MLDLRNRIFIIVSITLALLLVFILIYSVVFKEKAAEVEEEEIVLEQEEVLQEEVGREEVLPAAAAPIQPQTPPAVQQDPDELYAKQVARIFVERFGSYSNQNSNSHLEDALPLATESMAEWIKTQTVEPSGGYFGVTSKVISSSFESISGTEAAVRVGVQEFIEIGGESKTNYRTGRVNLLKIDGDWKVDGLYWD